MDYMTHAMLTTLHIEELLRERQARHEAGASWHCGPGRLVANRPTWPCIHLRFPVRLRRHLAARLIQAGRRLGDTARPGGNPLYGSAHR